MKLSLKKLSLSLLFLNLLAISPSYGQSSPEELDKRQKGKEALGVPPNDKIGKNGERTEAEVVVKSFGGENVKEESCSDCTEHGKQFNLVENQTGKQQSSPDAKQSAKQPGTK